MNPGGDGAKYWQSDKIGILDTAGVRRLAMIPSPWPDAVAGILAHWVGLLISPSKCVR